MTEQFRFCVLLALIQVQTDLENTQAAYRDLLRVREVEVSDLNERLETVTQQRAESHAEYGRLWETYQDLVIEKTNLGVELIRLQESQFVNLRELQSDYDALQNSYNALQVDYERLRADYAHLQSYSLIQPQEIPPIVVIEEPPITVNDLRRAIFEEVNKVRMGHGLTSLIRDDYLDTLANEHAFTMTAAEDASHRGFDARANSIFAAMPNVTRVRENVAHVNIVSYGDVGKYFAEAWYNSPEYRESMLNSQYIKKTGVGLQVFYESLTVPNYYAVQLFTD